MPNKSRVLTDAVEKEHFRKKWLECSQRNLAYEKIVDDLEKQKARLVEAGDKMMDEYGSLEKWCRHKDGCDKNIGSGCECGVEDQQEHIAEAVENWRRAVEGEG